MTWDVSLVQHARGDHLRGHMGHGSLSDIQHIHVTSNNEIIVTLSIAVISYVTK